MTTRLKHAAQEDQVNGLSPAKIPKVEDPDIDELSPEARITRVKDYFKGGKAPPIIKPKPKPKPRPLKKTPSVTVQESTPSPQLSPNETEDPRPIVLNPDSLAQFSGILDYDFDTVMRRQILDNTPQKDRAALSQSKGLQNRRLPANIASKVGDDYRVRRRSAYGTRELRKQMPTHQRSLEDTDSPLKEKEEMSEEKIMAKVGITHSNPLAALGNILRRRGSGRKSKSPTASPVPKLKRKPSKDSPRNSPDVTRRISEPQKSPPKSPKLFRLVRRSSSRNSGRKKGKGIDGGSMDGSFEDLRSETSSISSMTLHSTLHEESMSIESTPHKEVSPLAKERETSPLARENEAMDTSEKLPIRVSGGASFRDSAVFKEADIEPLFNEDSTLFGSGELDAILGKSKPSRLDRARERTPERILEEKENEREEVKPKETPKREPEKRKPVIKSRMQPYSLSDDKDLGKKPLSTSTPKSEVKPTRKTGLLFEDEGSAFAKKDNKAKSEVEKKKARLFEDELFQDEPKPVPKRELFGSPKHKTRESPKPESKESPVHKAKETPKHEIKESPVHKAKETPKHEIKESPVHKAKETPKHEIKESPVHKAKETPKHEIKESPLHKAKETPKHEIKESPLHKAKETPKHEIKESPLHKAKETPKHEIKESPKHDAMETTTASSERKASADDDFGRGISLADDKSLSEIFDELLSKKTTVEKPTAEESKKEADKGKEKKWMSIFEYDESPLSARKISERKKSKEKLDELSDSLFGEVKVQTKLSEERKGKKATDSLFDDDVRKSPKAGRRAKKASPEPAEKMEISETTSDPLGAISMKTDVEQKSEQRQKEKQASKEEKGKAQDFFGEEAMETDAPSDLQSSTSDQKASAKSPTPEPKEQISEVEESKKATISAKVEEKAPGKEPAPNKESKVEKEEPKRGLRTVDTKPKTESRPTSARGRFETGETRSPKVGSRLRSATDSATKTRTTGREDKKPAWMLEFQKRKEERKKGQEQAPSAKELPKEEAIPEWKKRVMERKKKAAEMKTADTTVAARSDKREKSTASPRIERSTRLGRTSPNNTATTLTGRRSPRSTDTKSSLQKSKEKEELEKSAEVKDKPKSQEEKPTPSKRPEASLDSIAKTKRPERAARSKIEVSTRKVEKEEKVEKAEVKKESWSEEIKPPAKSPEPTDKEPVVSTDKEPSSPKTSDVAPKTGEEPEDRKPTTGRKSRSEPEDDVFTSSSEKSSVSTDKKEEGEKERQKGSHSPSPQLQVSVVSKAVPKTASVDSTDSHHDSISSDDAGKQPFRSHNMSRSRSPTPTPGQASTGPLKPSTDSSIPEWKKQLLERKRTNSTSKKPSGPRGKPASEPEVPAWKKELLAKKKTETKKSGEVKAELKPRERAHTAALGSPSPSRSPRSGRRAKEERIPPDFMKEFQQKKKQRTTS